MPQPIESMPELSSDAPAESFDLADTTKADLHTDLYDDTPSSTLHTAVIAGEGTLHESSLGDLPLGKALPRFGLVPVPALSLATAEVDKATVARFESLCLGMQEASATIERLTAHLWR